MPSSPAILDPPASGPDDPPAFRAVVSPHAALTGTHARALAVLGLVLVTIVQIPLARAGAWPCGLFGLGEAGLLVGALWLHRRSQDRVETLTLVGGGLLIVRCLRGRVVEARRLPVFGLRVVRVDDPDYGCQIIAVESRGRRTEIGRDLSPDERPGLAEALVAALGEAGGSPRLRVETRRSLLEHLTPGDAR